MTDVIHRQYRDAADQENALPGWDQEYKQLSSGRYAGEVRGLVLPGVAIYREKINVATEQLFSAPKDRTIFYYYPKADGSQLVKDEPMTSKAGFAFNWIDRVGFMGIESDLLMVVFNQGEEHRADASKSGFIRGPLSNHAEFLGEWLSSLISGAELEPEQAGDIQTGSILAGIIEDRLHLLLEQADLIESASVAKGEQKYRRLRAYLNEICTDDLPTVRSLSRALNIEAVELRKLSQEYAGTSIEQLLIRLRLNGAHRELKGGLAKGKTVSQIAMNWGFPHWGRFSSRYHELFGQYPSTTLRESR